MKKVLVTGAAGFIGAHVSKALLANGYEVIGLDNLNDYYDITLKQDRLKWFLEAPRFTFLKLDLASRDEMERLFSEYQFDVVINLAAQAGVRYSIEYPHSYVDSNLVGFLNVLEGCRQGGVKHLLFASSSSVYGVNKKVPFATEDRVDHPISLYAATKKSNELMAHAYSQLYDFKVTGLRFFTVYGAWGRPDMACFLFTKAIFEGKSIDVYNHGDMQRDFTYIDDVVEAVARLVELEPEVDYNIYNIGNDSPELLESLISSIEQAIGKEAKKNYLPMQPGDVPVTYADVKALKKAINFKPSTSLKEGVRKFVDWYKVYYGVGA